MVHGSQTSLGGCALKSAEFSEQEYEGFLYLQLQQGDPRLWHPHEVLEKYLGFDRGIYVADRISRRLMGSPARMGFAPWYYYGLWPELSRAGVQRSRLPRFRLNCFIQAKRPTFSIKVPRVAKSLSSRRPVYRFSVSAEQHQTLDRVARAMHSRALFLYAAPTFHTSAQLFAAGTRRRVAEASTFPAVQDITGHEHWYYNEPGTVGIRNPDTEPVRLQSMAEAISILLQDEREVESASVGLSELAAAIRSALTDTATDFTARDAFLNAEWSILSRVADDLELQSEIRNYLLVDAFCSYFSLSWLTIGRAAG